MGGVIGDGVAFGIAALAGAAGCAGVGVAAGGVACRWVTVSRGVPKLRPPPSRLASASSEISNAAEHTAVRMRIARFI
jgi:hypothetical protein